MRSLVDAVPVDAVRDGPRRLGAARADEVAERAEQPPCGEVVALATMSVPNGRN
ncbi:hypothetical protein AB0I77_23525 [Streptomyces sp. NPDC050619]|uniref:hypothetical protein n=1 Tax=Streptomyces sp. NPDC050619 TaxID=3157214 RepID=UPI00342214E9